jgi:hypothetical protein
MRGGTEHVEPFQVVSAFELNSAELWLSEMVLLLAEGKGV